MALQMLRRLRIAREHVERHLFEPCESLFGEHHLDRPHIGGAIETPKNHIGHETSSRFVWRVIDAIEVTLNRLQTLANKRPSAALYSPDVGATLAAIAAPSETIGMGVAKLS